ncbi:MAG: tRNA preQ1(34) S-adenosylmethionine ribosyltransferase-isomerase QueA [Planctomycetia bacterium]|nr:tRNA preQ1(34) S-adenosylmethionine ribosyltransferase-isomerase QueA [Planctomycetia bacterium]
MSAVFLDYDLPDELIAQEPAAERDRARLLVAHRADASLVHRSIADLPELLQPGDVLILNDTRVVPARLLGQRARTGGKWEGLFLRVQPDGLWELLCQTRGKLTEGERIAIEPGPLALELVQRTPTGGWLARPNASQPAHELLQTHGQVPLPPYIQRRRAEGVSPLLTAADAERYQTVFAAKPGAVAAPTAGLHFTPALLDRLAERGITSARVTLHVGIGTFQPIQVEDFRQHRMHQEWGELPAETVAAITACRQRGGKVVAVGTTTVRVLETAARAAPDLHPWSGDTDLFIYPPYEFKVVDALLTNFHLPRSTLLLLVGAFAGVDLLREAYRTAIAERYRFYSYGDAMLIV